MYTQVRDEHRQDYDPGRGGWGAQAQRLEIERRREVEERYADANGMAAGGGGDWKEANVPVAPEATLKRGRSPEDDGSNARGVSPFLGLPGLFVNFLVRASEHGWATQIRMQRGCNSIIVQPSCTWSCVVYSRSDILLWLAGCSYEECN